MSNAEQLIDSMCMTWRHDFGLDKLHGGVCAGMDDAERDGLRGRMRQLIEHHGEAIAALYARAAPPPEKAEWRVKGDGVAHTTSAEILNSQAGRKLVEQAGKVELSGDVPAQVRKFVNWFNSLPTGETPSPPPEAEPPQAVTGSEMERTTHGVVVPRELLETICGQDTAVPQEVWWNQVCQSIDQLRALLQREV